MIVPEMKSGVAIVGFLAGCGRGARVTAAVAALAVGAGAALASGPEPPLRIPLDSIGYHGIPSAYLLAGGTLLTVHFVDHDHLLVTFLVHRLMKRDDVLLPDDEDGTIGAYLLELPSGKLLAQTDWRVHDRGQYLWNLGQGRFLLRIRDQLTVIAPMNAANDGDRFHEVPFLRIDRRILAIMLSPEKDLLTIESVDATYRAGAQGEAIIPQTDAAPVRINFYRLLSDGPQGQHLTVQTAGAVHARVPLALPVTTSGFVDAIDGGHNRWMFNFDTHAGKISELSAFDTTCYPRTTFVSHSEFVAFGCRGPDKQQDFAGFNLRGEEMWQQNFYDAYLAPSFSFAPSTGRFALGRLVVSGPMDAGGPLDADQVRAEEVRVYQTYSGKVLLRVECSPAERAGQNFELSPDGSRLAAVQETVVQHPATKDDAAYTVHTAAIMVYPLPALTAKDEAAVRDEQALSPEESNAAIRLSTQAPAAEDENKDGGGGAAASSVAASATESNAAPEPAPAEAAGSSSAAGDTQPTAPRKPPSLYAPGEAPQGKQPQ
jgi:hypothetical protein